jgi:hypothetical protein
VRATFARALPHVLATADGSVLVGSLDPLPVDLPSWLRRLDAATAYLGEGRARVVRQRLLGIGPAGAPPSVALNRDLFPRDEFAVPEE